MSIRFVSPDLFDLIRSGVGFKIIGSYFDVETRYTKSLWSSLTRMKKKHQPGLHIKIKNADNDYETDYRTYCLKCSDVKSSWQLKPMYLNSLIYMVANGDLVSINLFVFMSLILNTLTTYTQNTLFKVPSFSIKFLFWVFDTIGVYLYILKSSTFFTQNGSTRNYL